MKLPHRRHVLHLAAGAAALPAVLRVAWADTYPSRPVHIIAGYAAGGATDISARLVGQWLSERLGQQFVIDNRPGGSSNIGTELVVRAPPSPKLLKPDCCRAPPPSSRRADGTIIGGRPPRARETTAIMVNSEYPTLREQGLDVVTR